MYRTPASLLVRRYKSKGEPAVSVSICKEFALQFACELHPSFTIRFADLCQRSPRGTLMGHSGMAAL